MLSQSSVTTMLNTKAFEKQRSHSAFERNSRGHNGEDSQQQATRLSMTEHNARESLSKRQGQIATDASRHGGTSSINPIYYPSNMGNFRSENVLPVGAREPPNPISSSSSPSSNTSNLDEEDARWTGNPHPIPRTSRTSALTKLLREHQNNGDIRNGHHQTDPKPLLQHHHTISERRRSDFANRVRPELAVGLQQQVQLQPQLAAVDDPDMHDPPGFPNSLSPSTSPSLHVSTPDSPSPSPPSPLLSPRLSHSSSTSGLWMKGTFTGLDKEQDP